VRSSALLAEHVGTSLPSALFPPRSSVQDACQLGMGCDSLGGASWAPGASRKRLSQRRAARSTPDTGPVSHAGARAGTRGGEIVRISSPRGMARRPTRAKGPNSAYEDVGTGLLSRGTERRDHCGRRHKTLRPRTSSHLRNCDRRVTGCPAVRFARRSVSLASGSLPTRFPSLRSRSCRIQRGCRPRTELPLRRPRSSSAQDVATSRRSYSPPPRRNFV